MGVSGLNKKRAFSDLLRPALSLGRRVSHRVIEVGARLRVLAKKARGALYKLRPWIMNAFNALYY